MDKQHKPRQTKKGKRTKTNKGKGAKQQKKTDEISMSNTEVQIAPNNNINNQQAGDQTPNAQNNGASIPNAEDQEISVLAVSVLLKTTYWKNTWINVRNHYLPNLILCTWTNQ